MTDGDEFHDPSDEDLEREERIQKLKAEEAEDIRWLMDDARGRRFVSRVLEATGVFRSTFDANHAVMAFSEGRRNEGNRLMTLVMAHSPQLFFVMLKERMNG